eukprot:g15357.t1
MEALEPGEAIEGIEAIDGQELQFFLIDEILIHMPVTLSCTEDFFYEEDDLELLEKPRDAVAAQQQHDHGRLNFDSALKRWAQWRPQSDPAGV